MPTEVAYSSGHLVMSHFWTCKCFNVETDLSLICLVSKLLSSNIPRYFCFSSLLMLIFSFITWYDALSLEKRCTLHDFRVQAASCLVTDADTEVICRRFTQVLYQNHNEASAVRNSLANLSFLWSVLNNQGVL